MRSVFSALLFAFALVATGGTATSQDGVAAPVRTRKTVRVERRTEGFRGARADGAPDREFRSIHGTDDRFRILDTEDFPWRATCKLLAYFPSGTITEATAILIGRSHVLTAAHNVYSSAEGGWADDVEIVPAYDDGYSPYSRAFASSMRTWPQWTASEDPAWDMALVEIDEPLGDDTGWLGLWAPSDAVLRAETVRSAGYPLDLLESLGVDGMWGTLGSVTGVTASTILTSDTFDADVGQTGGGLWIDRTATEGSRYVVGVHARGDNGAANVGTRLTAFRFASIDAWMRGYDGPADLVVGPVTTTLPAVVEPGVAGQALVRVTNSGLAPANGSLNVYLARSATDQSLLGTVNVSLAAGASEDLAIDVTVPTGAGSDAAYVEVYLDEEDLVPESDEANNWAASGFLTLRTAPVVIPLPAKVSRRLRGRELARYRVTVPEGLALLSVRLRGTKCAVTVTDPDGAAVKFGRARGFAAPLPGDWTIEVENRTRTARPVRLFVRAK